MAARNDRHHNEQWQSAHSGKTINLEATQIAGGLAGSKSGAQNASFLAQMRELSPVNLVTASPLAAGAARLLSTFFGLSVKTSYRWTIQQKKKTITSAQKTRKRFAVFGRIAMSK